MTLSFSFDQSTVLLEFVDRSSFLDRLLKRGRKPSGLTHDEELTFALADLRRIADDRGDVLEISDQRIAMTHGTLGDLSSDTTEVLGLPPLVDLTFRTDAAGTIGQPDFRLTYEWRHAGQREIANRTGAILETSRGLRRIPGWMMKAIEVADGFEGQSGLDHHWEALSRFRQALGASRGKAATPLSMTKFLSGLEIGLADSFSISPRDNDQFDVVPFSEEKLDGEAGEISESMAELSDARLKTFQDRVQVRGARPAYKVGRRSYLVIDPSAGPVLRVMSDMQRAPLEERAAFIRNPRQKITEAVTEHLRRAGKLEGLSAAAEEEMIENMAQPAFVETREYSARVIGVTIYEGPSGPMIEGSGTTWMPEAFPEALRDQVSEMSADRLAEEIDRVREAITRGDNSVDIAGHPVAASKATLIALETQREKIGKQTGSSEDQHPAEEEQRHGTVILETRDNLEDIQWAARITPRKAVIPEIVPTVVKATLQSHQEESFSWKIDAWKSGLPGILNADEQGLGKTLQAISFLAWHKENWDRQEGCGSGPVLIVAPTSLLENWEQEVNLHLNPPGLGNIIRLYGSATGERKRAGARGMDTGSGQPLLDFSEIFEAIKEGRGHRYWILTTYTTLTNYQHSLAEIPFAVVVFDEIQALKNPYSLRARAALAMNAEFRIGLTGTPIENSTVDLWAITEQLIPGCLGSLKGFRQRYSAPEEEKMHELYNRVFERQGPLPPVALRRLKQTAAKDLPQKVRRLYPRVMSEEQASRYEDARRNLATGTPGAALKLLHLIRTVSAHPAIDAVAEPSVYIEMSARLRATFDILRGIRAKNERALVFIESIEMQYRFIELLKHEFGLNRVDLINGKTPIAKRQEIVNRFQSHLKDDRGFDVLVLGPKAAGTGLTLTAATNVIHLSRWWNPAVEEQCNDRVHRIGQTQEVSIHVPMAIHGGYREQSFDCLLQSLMMRKRKLASSALWPMGDTQEDVDQLRSMLADDKTETGGDPIQAAMTAMFLRDGIQMPDPGPDGSLVFS